MANARLSGESYPFPTGFKSPNLGLASYQDYLSWIKNEIILGRQVTIGVLLQGGDGPQYDHIVSVTAIGTNHAPTHSTYYDDDVLYFDDHGLYNLDGDSVGDETPAIQAPESCESTPFSYRTEALAVSTCPLSFAHIMGGHTLQRRLSEGVFERIDSYRTS